MKFQYFTVPRVSGVSGVSHKFESMWLTVSTVSEYQVFHCVAKCGILQVHFLRRRLKGWYRCAACCYHTFIKRIHLYYHAREKYTHVGVSQNNGESGQRGC